MSELTQMVLPARNTFEERARLVGLDPSSSSLLQVCAAEHGLDPLRATCLDLAAVALGKAPGEVSEEQARWFLGEHWVLRVCT